VKCFGYILLIVGFLTAAIITVLDEIHIQWEYFVPALMIGIAGVVLIRLSHRRRTRSADHLSTNIETAEACLVRIVGNITGLDAQKKSIDTYDVHQKIDQLFTEDLACFVNARESIAHLYGLRAYADVMSTLGAGERYLNRVWCASADGYIDEVNAYLEKAKDQFSEGLEKLRTLISSHTKQSH